MAYTDNCDLYAAVSEEGVNLVICHIMSQRPSLFNYATADVASNQDLWCNRNVMRTNDVIKYHNPIFTVMEPLPVIGADSPPVGLSYYVQLRKVEVDFYGKNNVFSLPHEWGTPKEQSFALRLVVCGALGCPDNSALENLPPPPQRKEGEPVPPVHVPGNLQCFELEVFVVGHFERSFILNKESLLGKVDDIEIVDITPKELENSIECYIKTAVTLALRQKLAIPLETIFVSLPLFGMGTVKLDPTPNPPVPNNPAIEEDQLKAFITMTVAF